MTLKQQFQNKINLLKSQEFPYENEYQFFDFLLERISKSKDLSELCNSDYLLALTTLEGKENFEVISETFSNICTYLNDEKTNVSDNIIYLLTTIYGLKKVNLLDDILKFENQPTAKEIDEIIKKYNPERDGIIFGKKGPKIELVACTVGYTSIGLDIFDNFNQLQAFSRHVSKCEDIDQKFTKFINYKEGYKEYAFLKKHYSKLAKVEIEVEDGETKTVNDMLSPMEIGDVLKQISDRYYQLSKNKKQFIKNTNKKILLYSSMLEIVDTLEEDKIANVKDDVFTKVDDSELSIEFLKILLEHNRKVYSKLELENIKKDKYNQIEKLFWENNIYINELNEETKNLLLKNGDIKVLKDIISFLQTSEFSWLHATHPNYVQIILNTTPTILQTVVSLIQNNVIEREFVKHHIGILMNDIKIPVNENDVLPCYGLFRKNISLLLQNTNNLYQKIAKNESIIFLDTEELLTSIELSKKYSLNLFSDNAKLYGLDLLNNIEKFDDLDQFIELGYKDYIQENPQLLRDDSKDIIDRLSIVTNIGLNPMNKENKLKSSIINGKNFYVANEKLNEYRLATVDEYMKNEDFDILNTKKRVSITKSTEKLCIVEYLDSLFKTSELEYQMNDMIISRNKVLRNIECLLQHKDEYDEAKIALSAIVYHSVIDNYTIEFIKSKLSEYKKKVYTKSL